MEIIVAIVIIVIVIMIIYNIALALITGIAYGYWWLSIWMAPVFWLLISIGAIVGFISAIKNAFKAVKAMREKEL